MFYALPKKIEFLLSYLFSSWVLKIWPTNVRAPWSSKTALLYIYRTLETDHLRHILNWLNHKTIKWAQKRQQIFDIQFLFRYSFQQYPEKQYWLIDKYSVVIQLTIVIMTGCWALLRQKAAILIYRLLIIDFNGSFTSQLEKYQNKYLCITCEIRAMTTN